MQRRVIWRTTLVLDQSLDVSKIFLIFWTIIHFKLALSPRIHSKFQGSFLSFICRFQRESELHFVFHHLCEFIPRALGSPCSYRCCIKSSALIQKEWLQNFVWHNTSQNHKCVNACISTYYKNKSYKTRRNSEITNATVH